MVARAAQSPPLVVGLGVAGVPSLATAVVGRHGTGFGMRAALCLGRGGWNELHSKEFLDVMASGADATDSLGGTQCARCPGNNHRADPHRGTLFSPSFRTTIFTLIKHRRYPPRAPLDNP